MPKEAKTKDQNQRNATYDMFEFSKCRNPNCGPRGFAHVFISKLEVHCALCVLRCVVSQSKSRTNDNHSYNPAPRVAIEPAFECPQAHPAAAFLASFARGNIASLRPDSDSKLMLPETEFLRASRFAGGSSS